ncbi:MAG: AAA family ATPase, partial [Nostoc sp.]
IPERLYRQKNKKQSEPVQSLIEILANAYRNTTDEREKEIHKRPEIAIYEKLAELLEKEILQGRIDFNEPGLENEILFQPSEKIKLEMTVASSMVKELAPLVLCLRYLAKPDELLIIDEPEMNLHPSGQVAITEFLAMLVQAGLKILITTHSPYILDHLSNLMKAAKYQDKESIKNKFYLERTEAFIPQEKVSVYLFENGIAKNILNEDGRIDWGTFGDISDDISHIFL